MQSRRPIARQDAELSQTTPLSGWITGVGGDGRLHVDFAGNAYGPLPARSVVDLSAGDLSPAGEPTPVLLAFDRGDPKLPIIMGVLRDAVLCSKPHRNASPNDLTVGDHLQFSARQDITLRCGEATITLQADGRIVIKGSRLISRASESNRIRGASVAIN
ncbi:DUF6484 domain-containing protein [Niveibacterium umoris]|uniref:DUF6484 domain-containing protein n=1 Tax=Niveibacterium umoris TaxID=1193620 RepID=A0A840BET2_9RHOO|nr:DUF6484 domain-containing protein [Niveibacterium umoris]MBB4011655.1 hypothetical protein [Niveibacterium umoris]